MTEEKPKFFVREATGLVRSLSATDALVGNIMGMGIGFVFVFEFYSSLLYPGVNLPYTVLIALAPSLIFSLLYYLFTVAMPRTGGDYVWITRIVHPAVGFLANFFVTFSILTFVGSAAAWVPIFGLAPMLAGLGLASKNSGLISLSTTVGSPPLSFVIAVTVLSLFVVPLFLRPKGTFRLLIFMYLLAAAGTLVLVGAFSFASSSAFASTFNQLSGMNYAKTILNAGLSKGWNLQMTLIGSVFTIINFLGFNNSAYYSGEVRNARRSQIIAMVGSVLIFAVFLVLVYGSANLSAGPDFLQAVSFLAGSGNANYTLPSPPVLNFLVVFANPNPAVIILSGMGLMATCAAEMTVLSFIGVRNIFAWSFDGLMPTWLTKLDSRRNSPYLSVIAVWIIGIVVAYLYIYTVFFSFLAYAAIGTFITFALASLAAMIFPRRRGGIYESSHPMVRKKVGGVPLISVLGIAGLIVSILLIYATIQPAVTPPPTGPPLIQALAYLFVPLTGVIRFSIFGIASYQKRRRGINLSLVYKEIPPE